MILKKWQFAQLGASVLVQTFQASTETANAKSGNVILVEEDYEVQNYGGKFAGDGGDKQVSTDYNIH